MPTELEEEDRLKVLEVVVAEGAADGVPGGLDAEVECIDPSAPVPGIKCKQDETQLFMSGDKQNDVPPIMLS